MKEEMSEFLKKAYATGRVRPVSEAFEEFPVEEEDHKGDVNYFVSDNVAIYGYKVGDIVFVDNFKYENGSQGKNHLFVIVEENNLAVPIEYFGMILSSNIKKQIYKSNIVMKKDNLNKLNKDSIVKTDILYIITQNQILFKIGTVDKAKIEKYKELYLNQ